MEKVFISTKSMTMDPTGKWIVDHYVRINVTHVQSFRVIDATNKEEFIMDVAFNDGTKRILAVQSGDLNKWVVS